MEESGEELIPKNNRVSSMVWKQCTNKSDMKRKYEDEIIADAVTLVTNSFYPHLPVILSMVKEAWEQNDAGGDILLS